MGRVRDLLATGANLASVSAFFGITAGGIYLALAIAVGLLTNTPWFWMVVLAPMGSAAFLVSLQKWQELYGPKSAAKLAQDWRDLDSYTIWQAACLWIGVPPVPRIDERHKAYPTLQKIKATLVAGHIKSVYGDTDMKARIARDQLLKLADLRVEQPAFLFPDEQG
jgi:hypothetical protein